MARRVSVVVLSVFLILAQKAARVTMTEPPTPIAAAATVVFMAAAYAGRYMSGGSPVYGMAAVAARCRSTSIHRCIRVLSAPAAMHSSAIRW
jgi:hypothetical protein